MAIAQLEAEATIKHLKDDIGGHFDVIEGRARPFIESMLTSATEIPGIAKMGRFTARARVVRVAMGGSAS